MKSFTHWEPYTMSALTAISNTVIVSLLTQWLPRLSACFYLLLHYMLFIQHPDWSSPSKRQLTTWFPNAFRAKSRLSPWLLRITTATALAHCVLALLLAFLVLETHQSGSSLRMHPSCLSLGTSSRPSMTGSSSLRSQPKCHRLRKAFSWWSSTSWVSFPIPFYYLNML